MRVLITLSDSTDPHIPNWTEPRALLDIISLGNLVLYACALEGIRDLESDQSVLLEWMTARDAYVFAVAAFQREFTTDGISNLFLESAKHFGASLYDYVTALQDKWELNTDSTGTDRDLFETALGDAFNFKTRQRSTQLGHWQGIFPRCSIGWNGPFKEDTDVGAFFLNTWTP